MPRIPVLGYTPAVERLQRAMLCLDDTQLLEARHAANAQRETYPEEYQAIGPSIQATPLYIRLICSAKLLTLEHSK
jgi:hypothetical protein